MNNALAALTYSIERQDDGTGRMVIEIEPDDLPAFARMFPANHMVAALVAVDHKRWGDEAKALRLSAFFRTPDVWRAIGSDAHFQAWARKQKCVLSGGFDWDGEKGEARCDFCHVRRAGEAGTAYKPEYSGVPMVHVYHQLQHDKGELGLLKRLNTKGVECEADAKAWFNKAALVTVQRWAWETLKAQLGFEHWNEVPPRRLKQWADQHGLTRLLPQCYRSTV